MENPPPVNVYESLEISVKCEAACCNSPPTHPFALVYLGSPIVTLLVELSGIV